MAIETKICGISTPEAMEAAVAGAAAMVGLVFYPRSPRYVTPDRAAALAARVPPGVAKVGLLVDPDDALIAEILTRVPLDMLQLHGAETPWRVADIRKQTERPVMKAIKVADAEDLADAEAYAAVAERLLFDAKPPKHMKDALPGGNALAFDWRLLAGRVWQRPWMLSGGLDVENLAEAVEVSGARAVDVSSGVEDKPGAKNPDKIAAFLAKAKSL
nr:phosphoribosylanthranilate isomerase [uncultured Brevundimonas sp.]